MSEPEALTVDVNGFPVRVWRKGTGPKIGFLAGFGGLPRWVPFLDELAQSRTVIVPSLPGFPGGDRGHTVLDTHLGTAGGRGARPDVCRSRGVESAEGNARRRQFD